jgi:hypothetical protein
MNPVVEPARGYLGAIQKEVSKRYGGCPVSVELRSSENVLSIYIINPHGIDIRDVQAEDFKQIGNWIVEYLAYTGSWKNLKLESINKLEIGFERRIFSFSVNKSIQLDLTYSENGED